MGNDIRTAIDAIIIQDKKLLMVRKKKVWILPGGKVEPGETDLECLVREIAEELSGTEIKEYIQFYKETKGMTPHTHREIRVKFYLAKLKSPLYPVSKEISEARWVGADDFSKYNLSDITSKIIESLQYDNYL